MAITITSGTQVHPGAAYSNQSLSQSTATALRTLDTSFDVLSLGMGTATGFGVNRYLLATDDAFQGRAVFVQATGTGEAKLLVGGGTSTGDLVFAAATDVALLEQRDTGWFLVQNSGATVATATGTA